MGNEKNVPEATTFPAIEKFPADVKREVKAQAALKDISIKDFVVQALRYALKNPSIIKSKEKQTKAG